MRRAHPSHSCQNCVFGNPPADAKRVECHRFPTVVEKHRTDWCGEYKLDEDAEKPKAA
jgi:hypothetical protein